MRVLAILLLLLANSAGAEGRKKYSKVSTGLAIITIGQDDHPTEYRLELTQTCGDSKGLLIITWLPDAIGSTAETIGDCPAYYAFSWRGKSLLVFTLLISDQSKKRSTK